MKKLILILSVAIVMVASSFTRKAEAGLFDSGIPGDWTCVGNCGASGADGDVTLAPTGGTQYGWVSTDGGPSNSGLKLGTETNGSVLSSPVFSANTGDNLEFYFNFVTSDGAGYADYAWSRLLDSSSTEVARLFTARTTPSGNSVPGFGMTAIAATIDPATVTIVPGGPTWSPLGYSSGDCYLGASQGCGYSDWVKSTYAVPNSGNYILEFGTVNWNDEDYQTGLAFDGITVGGTPIEKKPASPTVPEPATMLLFGSGLIGAFMKKIRKT